MPNVYESRVHLPRWRRAWHWLASGPGEVLWGAPLGVLSMLPAFYLGLWWPLLIIVSGVAFAIGWNCARRALQRDGRLDKI